MPLGTSLCSWFRLGNRRTSIICPIHLRRRIMFCNHCTLASGLPSWREIFCTQSQGVEGILHSIFALEKVEIALCEKIFHCKLLCLAGKTLKIWDKEGVQNAFSSLACKDARLPWRNKLIANAAPADFSRGQRYDRVPQGKEWDCRRQECPDPAVSQ